MLGLLSKKEGFSLVELLIAMALIAIMAGIATPQLIQQLPKWHMSGTTRNIMSNLMMARLRAIQENRQHRVRFTVITPPRYIIERNTGTVLAPNWIPAGGGQGYPDVRVDLQDFLGGDCNATQAVRFESGGTVTGCKVVVSTIRGPALTRTVSVNAATGNVKVE